MKTTHCRSIFVTAQLWKKGKKENRKNKQKRPPLPMPSYLPFLYNPPSLTMSSIVVRKERKKKRDALLLVFFCTGRSCHMYQLYCLSLK